MSAEEQDRQCLTQSKVYIYEPQHNKINKMTSAPSEDSDQPGHPPSLIRVFAVRMKKPWVFGYPLSAQQRLWSDWADAQADLSLRWAYSHFVRFVMRWLIFPYRETGITVGINRASSQENLSLEFVTKVDSNRPPQLHRLARVLKFRI